MKAKVKPGWSMSPLQVAMYWRLWAAACDAQKIPAGQRDIERRAAHERVFGAPISAKDINKTNEFDAIKAEFERMADVLCVPDDGGRRRLLHGAGESLAELEQYVAPQWLESFLKTGWRIVPGLRAVEDLTDDELRKLIIAAKQRAHDLHMDALEDKQMGKAMEIDEDMAAGPVLPGGSENQPF